MSYVGLERGLCDFGTAPNGGTEESERCNRQCDDGAHENGRQIYSLLREPLPDHDRTDRRNDDCGYERSNRDEALELWTALKPRRTAHDRNPETR